MLLQFVIENALLVAIAYRRVHLNYILNRLRVVVYDRFGLPITNGLDYSFSLAVDYHEE